MHLQWHINFYEYPKLAPKLRVLTNFRSLAMSHQINKSLKLTCSQFVRLFLIKESEAVNCYFNTYINKILDKYFKCKFDMVGLAVIPSEFREV